MSGLSKAIEQQGGLTCLANSLGLSKSVVFQWKVRGRVPAEYCPEIEKLTGGQVRCEDLNDKVDWAWLRKDNGAKRNRRSTDKKSP
jgi:DNA-binding transcriptional regulator YdaS (Cro superfamily)